MLQFAGDIHPLVDLSASLPRFLIMILGELGRTRIGFDGAIDVAMSIHISYTDMNMNVTHLHSVVRLDQNAYICQKKLLLSFRQASRRLYGIFPKT